MFGSDDRGGGRESPEPGIVAAAEGGTLLVVQFQDLSWSEQEKLVGFLKSQRYTSAGGTRARRADVRVIAETYIDVAAAVQRHEVREDLVAAFEGIHLEMPWLEQRRDDIPALAAHFFALACRRHELRSLQLSSEAVSAIGRAEWPGEIRQLGLYIEAAVLRATRDGATEVTVNHVFPQA